MLQLIRLGQQTDLEAGTDEFFIEMAAPDGEELRLVLAEVEMRALLNFLSSKEKAPEPERVPQQPQRVGQAPAFRRKRREVPMPQAAQEPGQEPPDEFEF